MFTFVIVILSVAVGAVSAVMYKDNELMKSREFWANKYSGLESELLQLQKKYRLRQVSCFGTTYHYFTADGGQNWFPVVLKRNGGIWPCGDDGAVRRMFEAQLAREKK
jgi:hypothetical protein